MRSSGFATTPAGHAGWPGVPDVAARGDFGVVESAPAAGASGEASARGLSPTSSTRCGSTRPTADAREALARLHVDGDDHADTGPAPQRPLTAGPDNARAWHLPDENHQGPDETETTTAAFAHACSPGIRPACR
ncbi:hypothetical protein SAHL_10110 [Salinisphaera orenii YIM 95161]|uniref:Uncharacterized protein n=1 Tax=Salinisphaera orenii YIM 95161 TaxID=1051139 RepID=A0A423PS38_9GAMM|nr:hypothetical protein SAHL_10110 [Salinisphaera halophila YIM 95161]